MVWINNYIGWYLFCYYQVIYFKIMMKLNILFIGKLPGTYSGGLEKYHELILYSLMEDDQFNISVITEKNAHQIIKKCINTHYIRKPQIRFCGKILPEIYYFIILMILLPFLLMKIKPDVIHVQYGNIFDPFYAFIAHLLGFKTIITMHVSSTWKHYKIGILRKIIIFLLKNMDRIVCISNGQIQMLRELNINISKVIHIPLAIDNIFFDYPKQIRNNKVISILYLGRICREKGILDLLEVYRNLRLKTKNIKLILVGPIDSNFRSILKEITNNNTIEGLKILDPVYDDIEKIKLYDKASIFVHPSYTDTMPISIIEALSRGCIVIATNIASIPELIESVGVLVEPGDIKNLQEAIANLVLNIHNYDGIREKRCTAIINI